MQSFEACNGWMDGWIDEWMSGQVPQNKTEPEIKIQCQWHFSSVVLTTYGFAKKF